MSILNKIRFILRWIVAVPNNIVATMVGLMNPREFMCYTFNYEPLAFFSPQGHGKFRCWFDKTTFGWWWTSTHITNSRIVRNRLSLRILVRIRFILTLPLELLYIPVSVKFGRHYWSRVSTRYLFNFRTIWYGYYRT